MAIEYITHEDEDFEGYEIYNLDDGMGQIMLRGDDFETGLLFDNKPIAFHWSDCQGSVGQYLVRATEYTDYKNDLQLIRDVVNDKNIGMPFSVSLCALLRLFESGQYLINEHTLDDDYDYFEYKKSHFKTPESYYPYDWTLIATQALNLLDEVTILKHIKQIKDGYSPKVIVTSVYENFGTLYVLDGHHKLEAYRRLDKKPTVINIVSILAKPLKKEEGILFVPKEKNKKEYLRVKTTYFTRSRNDSSAQFSFSVGGKKELFDAIYEDNRALVKELIEADHTLLYFENKNGLLACHYATALRKKEILIELLKYYKDINILDKQNNYTMIHYAISYEDTEMIKFLVEKGIDLNTIIKYFSREATALSMTISRGHFKTAKILLALGADPKVLSKDLIESCFAGKGAVKMIETLIEYGIKPTKHHQWTTQNPEARTFLNNYFLALEGVGGNIVYEKEEKNFYHLEWLSILEKSHIDDITMIPDGNSTDLRLNKIIEWENEDVIKAQIVATNKKGQDIKMFSRDYTNNIKVYGQGDIQTFFICAIVSKLEIPMQNQRDYVAMFGKVKEKDFRLWSHYNDSSDVEFMGKIEKLENRTIEGELFYYLEVKTKISEKKGDFFVLPLILHYTNNKIKNLKVGDIVEGHGLLECKLRCTIYG